MSASEEEEKILKLPPGPHKMPFRRGKLKSIRFIFSPADEYTNKKRVVVLAGWL
jgi:hypothetical protein